MKKDNKISTTDAEPVVVIGDDVVSYTVDLSEEFYANSPITKDEIVAYEGYVNTFTADKLSAGVKSIKKDIGLLNANVTVTFGSHTAMVSKEGDDVAVTIQTETKDADKWLAISKLLSYDN